MKSSELAKYIKENAKHNDNGTYEIKNVCFEVDVPYIISYLDEGVGLDWYKEVYEPVSEPQINAVITKLKNNKSSRQAQITMADHNEIFNPSYICTTSMTYYIENDKVNVSVCMRSNDVKRFPNDVVWQQHTLKKICKKLNMLPGKIFWYAVSMHVYDEEWFYFEKLPHNVSMLFNFQIRLTIEDKSYNNIISKIEHTYLAKYNREIYKEGNITYVTFIINTKSIINGRLEAYFTDKEGKDIKLEEEYEYGIDDIVFGEENLKNKILTNIFKVIKDKNLIVSDIEAKEISHKIVEEC